MLKVLAAALILVPAASAADPYKNDQERTLYAFGYEMARKIGSLGFSAAEIGPLVAGFKDAASSKSAAVNMPVYGPKVNELIEKKVAAKASSAKKDGAAFAEKFSKEQGVAAIPNGGWIKHEKEGSGDKPAEGATVKVHYKGTLIDGTEFDSSHKRGQPAEFALNQVIPCWTNGVAQMKKGGKARLVCPSDAAYGDSGHPPVIPGGATLVFDVELLDIVKK